MNIMQWNSQSLTYNKNVFKKFLHDNNIHIAIISETWLKPHVKFNINGYTVVRNDCGNSHNGVAIIIHKSLHFQQVSTHFDDALQNVVIQIQIYRKLITIVSFYCPPNSTPRFNKNKLNTLFKSLSKPMIVAGDFNAHHTVWGCTNIDSRGRDIIDIMEENDLVLLNDGSPTTVGSFSHRPNGLDLTMVSSSLSLSCEWMVCDTPLAGYHLPTVTKYIFDSVSYLAEPSQSIPKYVNHNLVDWSKYKNKVNEELKNYAININDPLDSYDKFCSILSSAMNNSVIKSKTNKQSNLTNPQGGNRKIFLPLPWWNEKCTKVVDNCKQAYVTFKSSASMDNFIAFKRAQAIKKVVLKAECRDSWEKFCSSVNRLVPMSHVWAKMRKFNRTFTYNKSFLSTEWIHDFLHKYTPATVENVPEFGSCNRPDPPPSTAFLNDTFTLVELKSALKSRKDTTCGLDGISYKMLKFLDQSGSQLLLDIINLLWHSNLIPREWKIDCLVPILKPEKDPNVADSYRPITLSSCVGKIFEQLLKQRIEFFIEHNNILPKNQFGFRRGYSARESLSHLSMDVSEARHENKVLVAVFLDIVGAFNNVNLHILSSILTSLQFPKKIVSWIFGFLHGREIFVKYNNNLVGSRFSFKGVSQGGILSPLMFILYIHRLNLELGCDVSNLQFADDLVVYCTGRDVQEINRKLNYSLLGLKKYFDHLNLEVSHEKSKIVIFSSKSTRSIEVFYDNHLLPIESHTRFLGVIFQGNGKWNKYVDCLSDRALKACNILKSLAGISWGSDPKILLTLYKSLVRSHFEYGFMCYSHISNLVEKLNKIQNRCLRIIMGAMISTPIISMQIEANIPPLSLRFKYLKFKFLLSLLSIRNHPLISKLNQCLSQHRSSTYLNKDWPQIKQLKSNYNLNEYTCLPCYSGSYLSKFCEMNIIIDKTLKFKQDVYAKLNEFVEYRHVYTDGAKNNNAVAIAYYDAYIKKGSGYMIPEAASIFTAESSAILASLDHIEQQVYHKWVIVSDCMSVLKALSNPRHDAKTSYIIHLIRQRYFEISQYKSVILFWTPSHVGVFGNDSADFLARSITNTPNVSVSIKQIPLPVSDLLVHVKAKLIQDLKNLWVQVAESKGKWYAEINNKIRSPWFNKDKKYYNRKFFTTLCRLRLGHCRFNAHLHRLNIISSPICNFCNSEPQTLHHIFFDCSTFSVARLVFIDNLLNVYGSAEEIPRSLQQLLRNVNCFKAIYEFIVSTVVDI